jgi:hypothetical protein
LTKDSAGDSLTKLLFTNAEALQPKEAQKPIAFARNAVVVSIADRLGESLHNTGGPFNNTHRLKLVSI